MLVSRVHKSRPSQGTRIHRQSRLLWDHLQEVEAVFTKASQ